MDRKNWIKKKTRLKNKLRKSNNKHRLIVFRSNKHIYGQVLDVENGKISVSSPLARALLGKKIDDMVEVLSPGGSREYEVENIEFI